MPALPSATEGGGLACRTAGKMPALPSATEGGGLACRTAGKMPALPSTTEGGGLGRRVACIHLLPGAGCGRLHHELEAMKTLPCISILSCWAVVAFSGAHFHLDLHAAGLGDLMTQPYLLDTGLDSRSISFENPTGARGEGGKASSKLGVGRKGTPARTMKPGETVTLCDIAGPGTIRHIWVTMPKDPELLRAAVVRAYWEGQTHPSVECPIGDLMGFAHGRVLPYQSAVHSVGENAGMNLWLPMPFAKQARFTFSHEGRSKDFPLFYQIDYTLRDQHPRGVGRLHVLFRRENPTTLKQDFELLPKRSGRGRFVGSVIGIRALEGDWWGEGEVKVYRDGDGEFPTICGTGSEDYVGLSWGIQQTPFLFNGCSLNQKGFVSMYRWHLPDPVYWEQECRITIQQIGWKDGLYERQDDWSTAAFWYEPVPSAPLPTFPELEARVSDVWRN
ncbi:MAG: DUF2961 domain-containing protein [Verrucomicrobia bacterium]|nr:DUF2961 domain-containing protein [Verrucomicrobiota bacterium]